MVVKRKHLKPIQDVGVYTIPMRSYGSPRNSHESLLVKGATSWDLKNVWDLSASAIEQTPVASFRRPVACVFFWRVAAAGRAKHFRIDLILGCPAGSDS